MNVPVHKSKLFDVVIYSGDHFADSIIKQYQAIGSIDQVIEGARVKCRQMIKTRGRRIWVDFKKDNTSVTHRIFGVERKTGDV